jgi:hypothetical protein
MDPLDLMFRTQLEVMYKPHANLPLAPSSSDTPQWHILIGVPTGQSASIKTSNCTL